MKVRLGLVLLIIHGYQLTYYTKENNEKNCATLSMFTRQSGDVIRRTGKKNFKAVSHNRARPSVLFPNSLQYFHRQNSTDHSVSTTFPVTE